MAIYVDNDTPVILEEKNDFFGRKDNLSDIHGGYFQI